MRMFNIDNACAGHLKLENGIAIEKDDQNNWFCILADYGLVSFKIGAEVMFASGKMGQVVFDDVESVDVENQTVKLVEYGTVELKNWEYFARI